MVYKSLLISNKSIRRNERMVCCVLRRSMSFWTLGLDLLYIMHMVELARELLAEGARLWVRGHDKL